MIYVSAALLRSYLGLLGYAYLSSNFDIPIFIWYLLYITISTILDMEVSHPI